MNSIIKAIIAYPRSINIFYPFDLLYIAREWIILEIFDPCQYFFLYIQLERFDCSPSFG